MPRFTRRHNTYQVDGNDYPNELHWNIRVIAWGMVLIALIALVLSHTLTR